MTYCASYPRYASNFERRPLFPDILSQAGFALISVAFAGAVGACLIFARPGGTITLVGMTPQGQRASFDVYRFVEDGKVLRGSNYGSANPAMEFPRIAGEYLEGKLRLDLLITERIGLEQLDGAFEAMRRGDGARRVVVY